jgi:phosphonate transport system substrate-binding protein
MKLISYIALCSIIIFHASCYNKEAKQNDIIEIDFNDNQKLIESTLLYDTLPTINVAVAAIISPRETFSYYNELFEFISVKIDHQINFKQRKTYQEINDMLNNREVEMAFICSGAYVEEKLRSDIEILAVPVCNGKPMYQAYIITDKSSQIENFKDFQGKSFAFTDPLSNTGKLYADSRLAELNTTAESFFSYTIFSYGHDLSMQLVSKGVVDGATIDGLIYEYRASFFPEHVKNLKVIEKSEDFGIPPIVVPKDLDENLKDELRKTFYSIHKDSTGKKILDLLLIEKFIPGEDKNYDGIRRMK